MILLDTQVRGKPHGVLGGSPAGGPGSGPAPASRAPCLIALHHQAVPVGCAWLDQHNLKNADDLFAVLARHPQQKTIPVRPRPSGV